MTTHSTAPLYTSRTLPEPWTECKGCDSHAPALFDVGGQARCPACAAHDALMLSAANHLAALLAPALGAWGHYWQAAGLTEQELTEYLETRQGIGLIEEVQREQLTEFFNSAMLAHTPPRFTHADPDRVQLDAQTLPRLVSAQFNESGPVPEPGQVDRRLSFVVQDAEGQISERSGLLPGRDAVLILNATPDGDALLYFTGMGGQTDPRPQPAALCNAYQVPAHLLPQVRAALGYFPEGAQ